MAVKEECSVRIDIGLLESSIKDMLPPHSHVSPKCCIFRTPAILKRHNEEAYIPKAFSIGPLHHDNPNLKATEKIKVKYFQGFISRSDCSNEMLRTLIRSITEMEKEARECYAEAIDPCSPEKFLKILVIDGCFIIELFCRKFFPERREENDPIFSMSTMLGVLDYDLIMLENQVPWMVLEHLFSLIVQDLESNITLSKLAYHFFLSSYPFEPTFRDYQLRDIKHIPDLFRKLFISSVEVEKEEMSVLGWELMPSATSLVKAGIKFKKSTSNNMFDIKFRNGVLEIPQILIHEVTEILFRNLISFEQCYPNDDGMITSYAILLDNLINTEKDVQILCEKKILRNWLNPEDAVKLFNKLYLDTCVRTYYYKNLCKQVNTYCGRCWPRSRAVLMGKYFNTPWASLSTSAAIILLILTLLQTIFTIKE